MEENVEIKETLEFILNKIESEEYNEETRPETTTELNPFDFSVSCDSCKSNESIFWRRITPSKIVCNKCFFTKIYLLAFCDSVMNKNDENEIVCEKKPRAKRTQTRKLPETKSSKIKTSSLSSQMSSSSSGSTHSIKLSSKNNNETLNKQSKNLRNRKSQCEVASKKATKLDEEKKKNEQEDEIEPKEISRRSKVFKVETPAPSKCEVLVSTIETSEFVFHRGFYMQVGDIVALLDLEDKEGVYFAQIRAFLTDQYGQKSGVITWLIPAEEFGAKRVWSAKDFDPRMFVLGPVEDLPRPLECMEFVCRLVDFKQQPCTNFDEKRQFQNDLLRHKFALNDLASANFKLITRKNILNCQTTSVEHQVKFS